MSKVYPEACVWKIFRISILCGLIYSYAMEKKSIQLFLYLACERIIISGPKILTLNDSFVLNSFYDWPKNVGWPRLKSLHCNSSFFD